MATSSAEAGPSSLPRSYQHAYPTPQPGASLLLAWTPPSSPAAAAAASASATTTRSTVLIVGQHRLAAARAFAILEAGYKVIVAVDRLSGIDPEVQARLLAGEISSVDLPSFARTSSTSGGGSSNDDKSISTSLDEEKESLLWGEWLAHDVPPSILHDLALVCVADTIASSITAAPTPRLPASALALRLACFNMRIPLNVADHPNLCDFHFPATHRFSMLPSQSDSQNATPSESKSRASPLQIAITTNAKSCRLASRVRREIVAKLPKGIGSAVARVGELRELARAADGASSASKDASTTTISQAKTQTHFLEAGEFEEGWTVSVLNKPVEQILLPPVSRSRCTSPNRARLASSKPIVIPNSLGNTAPLTPPATPPSAVNGVLGSMEQMLSGETPVAPQALVINAITRMRFIAQISEYWPIEKLATLSAQEAQRIISLYSKEATSTAPQSSSADQTGPSITNETNGQSVLYTNSNGNNEGPSREGVDVTPRHQISLQRSLTVSQPRGRIFLLGSGPGSPALLTMAAHALLTKHATLILSDKLVPPQILALIPKHIPLTIAKKFPGNAEGAQNELMDLALEGALRGETVVRLKQGDPFVYGRGGEEVLFFRERGFEAIVIPGISSAFAAPLMAGIPVTQRGVSESVVVCTGVGRKGKGVKLPGYERARTTVVLMGVARLAGVVHALTSSEGQEGHGREGGARDGPAYPPYCPIAIIERASSPDQRLVASTLEGIVEAMDRAGEQRPPGMMIIGWSALALEGKGDVEVLDSVEGLSEEQLEQVDRERVSRWLGDTGYIVREGLDDSWERLLDGSDVERPDVGEMLQ